MQRDATKEIQEALQPHLDTRWPAITVESVLHVEDDWRATDSSVKVLVANDSPPTPLLHKHFAEPLLRVTAIGRGRTQTREIAADAADWISRLRIPGIRINNVSTLAEGRGRSTGNALVFFTVPAIVRPVS
jgi:hypothetical protein